MKKCICCHKRSREIMGPLCGALKCNCTGVKCPHDGTRLRPYRVRFTVGTTTYPDSVLVECDECGCAWTGHPDNSELQASFLCQYVQKTTQGLVLEGATT